jgi:DNA-directed RNA polymerase subunit beta'
MITSLGKLLIDSKTPQEYREHGTLDKGGIDKMFTKMAKEMPPDAYADALFNMSRAANKISSTYGEMASARLRDLYLPEELSVLRDQMRKHIYAIQQDPRKTSAQKSAEIVQYVKEQTPFIDKKVTELLYGENNAFGVMAGAGIKGSKQQLRQLVFGDLLTIDSSGKAIGYPTLNSYTEGITPLEYLTASHGGRSGYIAVQKATADSGYLSKRVRQVAHRQVIMSKDCGKARAYYVDADDENNIGTLLFEDTKGIDGTVYPKNTIITEDILENLKGDIAVRNPLTCGQHNGVCAMCEGVRESNKLGFIGEAVGLNGVNSFLEGVTQSALSAKHGGGEAVQTARIKKGFAAIEQFIDMPEEFVGGAVISDFDGMIGKPEPAPQGGYYVTIGKDKMHIDADRTLKVAPGTEVSKGDVLTDGMVNVSKVTKYKGVGAGRKAFTDNFINTLADNDIFNLRRNIETMARGYISKVKITDPDGCAGKIIGDITDYDELESIYKPREGFQTLPIAKARNMYLEKPASYFSIGTRVTPDVIKELKRNRINDVVVHPEPPPFEAIVIPAKQFVANDEDFIVGLSGENLMRSIKSHVSRGAETEKDSSSYYPRTLFMSYIGEKEDLIKN